MKFARNLSLIALFVPSLLFGLSQKYKDWASSPQAYYMTKAERLEWATILSDADAEKFVNRFLASRGAGFAEEVADRAAKADQFLTIGKTKAGSKTLRGKVIVLLGPPAALKTETKKGRINRASTASGYGAAAGDTISTGAGSAGGSNGGTSVGEMIQVAQQSGMAERQSYVEYTITYSGEHLPPAYANGVTITIDADTVNGEDWTPDAKSQAKLDELFEAVAAARVKP